MCYNISAKKQPQELEKRFKAKVADGVSISPHFYLSGFNHPKIPVISSVQSDVIQTFHWV